MILVDTSVWIEVFRKPSGVQLGAEVDLDEVVTCLPVIQEVLQGFRDEKAFHLAKKSITAFPVVESPLQQAVFEEAVQLYRTARQAKHFSYAKIVQTCWGGSFSPGVSRPAKALEGGEDVNEWSFPWPSSLEASVRTRSAGYSDPGNARRYRGSHHSLSAMSY